MWTPDGPLGPTGLNSVERKCGTPVRKSRSEISKREKKVWCVGIQQSLPLCYTERTCMHRLVNALAAAPVALSVAPVSGTRKAFTGSRARPLRGASWRDRPRNIAVWQL